MWLSSPVGRGRLSGKAIPAAFSVGLIAGGLVTAAPLGVLGESGSNLPLWLRVGLFGVMATIALGTDTGVIRRQVLPEPKRQIPQSVFQKGLVPAGLRFGFELGLGWRTFIPRSAPYALLAWLVTIGGSLSTALWAGVAWGIGRSLSAWIRQSHGQSGARDLLLAAPWGPIGRYSSVASVLLLGGAAIAVVL